MKMMKTNNYDITEDTLYAMAENSLYGFVLTCLPHYLQLPSADFHPKLASLLDDKEKTLVEVIGFRDSAKSTYGSLAFILWACLTKQFKFIVIINDTSQQVDLSIANIKYELENNQYIKHFFGHLIIGESWSSSNLLLSNGVRIIGRSRGMNIRGIRHRESRPDLIVVDDPENLQQVRKKENRDKTEQWFNAEVLPARATFGAKLVVIGNLLHNDGFIARLSKNPRFDVMKIPLVDENGQIAWLAKYPNKEALEKKREEVGVTAWAREYLLKIIAEDDQVIKETDIQRYPNELLTKRDVNGELGYKITDSGVGGDLAISEKQTADFTAFVSGYKISWGKDKKNLIILPTVVKKRMDFHRTQEEAIKIADTMPIGTKFFIEDVGYQRSALQGMQRKGLSVYPMRPITDKKARLETIAPFVKDGTVLFPEQGCEDLIHSIINFGIEEHDDDLDAFVYLVMGLINNRKTVGITDKPDKM